MTRSGPRLDPLPSWLGEPWVAAIVDAVGPVRFVGGVVRDTLLGRPIGDLDLATPEPPEAVIRRLRSAGLKAVPTGLDHGTVTAVADGGSIEITTLRRDVATDGRHAVVAFTDDWAKDAARRDLTMNALYLDRDGLVWDPLGTGFEDCLAGRVRFVGDAHRRIEEDMLRLLRFYRFQATHGRVPADRSARDACRALAPGLARLPGERIRTELLKLLAAPDPAATLQLMIEDGVADHILPKELAPDRLQRLVRLEAGAPDALLRLAAILPGDALSDPRLRALRFSNKESARLAALLSAEPPADPTAPRAVQRRQLHHLGPELWADRLRLRASTFDPVPEIGTLLARAPAWQPPAFPITGDDALAAGFRAGPEVGRALSAVMLWWEEADFIPDREACLAMLAHLREDHPDRSS